MLGQHPQMLGLPETNLFARGHFESLRKMYDSNRRQSHGLLRAISELALDGGQNAQNVKVAEQWLSQDPDISTAELFRDLMAFARPLRLVDKSPLHVYSMESMERMIDAFPDAMFLHLTRHPRGNCESIYKLHKRAKERAAQIRGEKPLLDDINCVPDKIWCYPHLLILDFLSSIPLEQQYRMRAEDFLVDPDHHLKKLANWLQISTEPEAIEAMKHPENSPFACFGPAGAVFGNDPGFLQAPKFRQSKGVGFGDMEGPLSWDDELFLGESVREVANLLGY
jgi:hypothetical protein